MATHVPQAKPLSLYDKLEEMSSEDVFREFLNAGLIEDAGEERRMRDVCSQVLYNRHIYDVESLIHAKGVSASEVFSISSEVFKRAFTRPGAFNRFEKGSVSKWLGRITVNEVNSHFRYLNRTLERMLDFPMGEDDKETPIEKLPASKKDFTKENEAGEKLAWIFSKASPLNDKEREALRLVFQEDLPIEVVAQVMGKAENTIRNIITKARKKLKVANI